MFKLLFSHFKSHHLFVLYIVVIAVIILGLNDGFDPAYAQLTFFYYFLPLIGFYLLVQFFGIKWNLPQKLSDLLNRFSIQNRFSPLQISLFFCIFLFLIFLTQFFFLKGFPGFEALMEFKVKKLVFMRRHIVTGIPTWFAYVYSFSIKAIIPLAILYTYASRQKYAFYFVCLLAFVFGINAMQKGHILTFFVPVLIYIFFEKNYKRAALLSLLIFLQLLILVFIANPSLKYTLMSPFIKIERTSDLNNEIVIDESESESREIVKANKKAVNSLLVRTFYLPGATVGRWYESVPDKRPFLYGKGYKWYAKISGQKYHDYGNELYGVIYPNYVKRGLKGRVNAASFMYDYVNLKEWGLLLSALVMALILSTVFFIFYEDFKFSVALNLMPVLYLSSTSYTTLLLSGGWGLIILFYILFISKSKSLHDQSLSPQLRP